MLNLDVIKNRTARIIDLDKCQKFAVLLPLLQYKGKEVVLFEIRSQKLTVQPGEICFPGGGSEPHDKNGEATAIRETSEELGLATDDIELIGPLDLLITPFQTVIYPFVGRLHDYSSIAPNKEEVESIFYVPLEFFLNNQPRTFYTQINITPPHDFPYDLLPNGKTYNWRVGKYPVHFYRYQDKVIWGITARIIHNFIQILKKTD